MLKKILLACLLIVETAIPAKALTTGKGVYYKEYYNEHGIKLTSYRDIIYLGKSCDSYSPQYGSGTWRQFNGGIKVYFYDRTIGFPRQQVHGSDHCLG